MVKADLWKGAFHQKAEKKQTRQQTKSGCHEHLPSLSRAVGSPDDEKSHHVNVSLNQSGESYEDY